MKDTPLLPVRFASRAGWRAGPGDAALLLLLLLGACLEGCASHGHTVKITTIPPDARIRIDNEDRGSAPLTETFHFSDVPSHTVTASRYGYEDQTMVLPESFDKDELVLTLQPHTRRVTFQVGPAPAIISVDGKPLSPEPITQITTELEFTVDPKDHWIPHTASAERPGYARKEVPVRWEDQRALYQITLDPLKKDLHISTDPPGADVFIDGEPAGKSPVTFENYVIPYDPKTNHWDQQEVKATKPGYLPATLVMSWDKGQQDYSLKLEVQSKTVQVTTEPPGAVVTIDGRELPRDDEGNAKAVLTFPPVDDKGTFKTYTAVAHKPSPNGGPSDWEPTPIDIGWDNGRQDYSIQLRPGKTRSVALIRPAFARDGAGWSIKAEQAMTRAQSDTAEPGAEKPKLIYRPEGGAVIDMIASAPSGAQLALVVLKSGTNSELQSQIRLVPTDGTGAAKMLDLGGTINLTPAYAPDGSRLLFSSDRGGGSRLCIWTKLLNDDAAQPVQVTGADTLDLWPSLDSFPRPRLFYQAMSDARPQPRLMMIPFEPGAAARPDATDLHQPGGQPRVNPKADRILFTLGNEQTRNRSVEVMPDTGGPGANLTDAAHYDDFDAVWSHDGSKIAFVTNRPLPGSGAPSATAPTTRPAGDYNIWVMEADHPDTARPVTANASWDDRPAWDATGKAIYFRSNRGGEWAVWKIATHEGR